MGHTEPVRVAALTSLTLLAPLWWGSAAPKAPDPQPAPSRESDEWCAAPTQKTWTKLPDRKDPRLTVPRAPVQRYEVTLQHHHTRELLPVRGPLSDATISQFLRCRVTGKKHPIDRRLVELVVKTAIHFRERRVEIVSGYRSPKFNELWRKKGHQVSPRSRHVQGLAVDFHLPSTHARRVSKYLRRTHRGGVGTYVASNFVHVDFGRKRSWGRE